MYRLFSPGHSKARRNRPGHLAIAPHLSLSFLSCIRSGRLSRKKGGKGLNFSLPDCFCCEFCISFLFKPLCSTSSATRGPVMSLRPLATEKTRSAVVSFRLSIFWAYPPCHSFPFLCCSFDILHFFGRSLDQDAKEFRRPRPSRKLLSRRTPWLSPFGHNRPGSVFCALELSKGGVWEAPFQSLGALCFRRGPLSFV